MAPLASAGSSVQPKEAYHNQKWRQRLSRPSRNGALVCLLGFAATRIWVQGVLYDSYRSSDFGSVSFLSSLVYSLAFLVVALAARRNPVRPSVFLAAAGFALMVCAPFLGLAYEAFGGAPLMVATSLLAGLGMVSGFLLWSAPYSRLSYEEALLYTFASMIITALGSFALSFASRAQSLYVCVLMAPVVLSCYRQVAKGLYAAGRASEEGAPAAAPQPSRAFWIVMAGTSVFGLVLGISRGYPAGAPVALDATLRSVHQWGVAALSAVVVALTVAGRPPRLETLWRTVVGVGACAVLLLVFAPNSIAPLAAAVVNIDNSFLIGVMWVTMIHLVQADGWYPYRACAWLWCVRGFSRDLGRALLFVAPAALSPSLGIGVSVLALAVSAAFLLVDGLFTREDSASLKQGGGAAAGSAPDGRPNVARAGLPSEEQSGAGDIDDVLLERARSLAQAYGLTERETQVAALIARGHSKARVAEQLGLKESTVKTHAKNVYAKLDISSREELMEKLEGSR